MPEKKARKLLAHKLRLLRLLHRWSQETLAEASGLHRTYISSIERSRCNVSLDNIEKLANAFDVSMSELLRGTEYDNQSPLLPPDPVEAELRKRA